MPRTKVESTADAVEEQKKADLDDIFVEEDGGDEEKADDGEKTE